MCSLARDRLPRADERLDREQARRWSIVHERFVSDPLVPARPGSDFYFDLLTMLPKVPPDVFDHEALAW